MKHSLLKDIIGYAKTKGRAPLDERQMNTLKDLYIELAKSTLLGCMVSLSYMAIWILEIWNAKLAF